ncbi:MAG TPA: MotA/TolQ/ExbB proton channel family protein [Opitutaceae bacterium]|nr:MotA/TolQ/ExbB proton channel family protein [Opitutaceae bacterium]
MSALGELVARGGWVMPVIVALSVVLYWRCFGLLLGLGRERRRIARAAPRLAGRADLVERLQHEAQASFRRQRAAVGAMIAAAPLLGLLGTVSGMEKTFEGLSARAGEKSMESLAGGISEVLVATESGLAVAIPAMVLVYFAHREVHRQVELLNRLGSAAAGGRAA